MSGSSAKGGSFAGNEKVNSSSAACPLKNNTRTPCDVESLKVEDGASGRSIALSKSRVKELAPKDAPARILPALARFDAVLELLSAADETTGNSEDAKKKNVKLNLSAMPVGQCPLHQHLAIKVAPLDPRDKEDGKAWVNTTPDTLKIFGRAHLTDKGPAKWIAPFWQFGEEQVKQLAVSAESCGVLASGKPNRAIKCLVRVYRDDVYTLTFQVPAFQKIEREWKAAKDLKGTVTKESSYERSTFGDKVSEESHKTERNDSASGRTDYTSGKYGGMDQQGNFHAQEYGRGIKDGAAQIERTSDSTQRSGAALLYRTESTITATDTKTLAKRQFVFDVEVQKEIKPTLSLKRNDSEVDFTKAINDIINLQKKLTEAFNEIKKWVPEVGWWVKVDLSLLTGQIEGSWGHRYPKTPKDGERYKLVEEFYAIDFNLKLLDCKVTLGAGIDFGSSGMLDWFAGGKVLEVILKIEGVLTCEVAVNKKLISSSGEAEPVEVTGAGKADIYAQGLITVMAVTYEAKAGVKGGLEFKGTLVGSLRVTPHIDGEVGFVETIAYVTVKKGGRKRSEQFETVIFQKKEIWKGKMPSTA